MNNNKDLFVVSLVARKSLAYQHVKNFNKNDIKMNNYLTINKNNNDTY